MLDGSPASAAIGRERTSVSAWSVMQKRIPASPGPGGRRTRKPALDVFKIDLRPAFGEFAVDKSATLVDLEATLSSAVVGSRFHRRGANEKQVLVTLL